jgi:hypothetical protein
VRQNKKNVMPSAAEASRSASLQTKTGMANGFNYCRTRDASAALGMTFFLQSLTRFFAP